MRLRTSLGCPLVVLSLCLAGASAGKKDEPVKKEKPAPSFQMGSPAFKPGQSIPRKNTCDGKDVSPELSWSGIPKGTKSLALIMDDPDAPVGTWVHLVLYDIPADGAGLEENLPKEEKLSDGSKHGLSWGVEEFEKVGYYGPCPPPGKAHRYFFKLYALDKMLEIPSKTTKNDLLRAMKGRILGQAELMGLYKR